jgi:hypothetical protein
MRERDRGLASLATDQHGVVSIRQLEQRLGFSHQAVGSVRGKLAPEKGTRPSRPRPWQAVAVAETAGGAGSGGRVAGAPWECHGSVTDV